MYRPDGHAWDAQQEPRGNPDQYSDDSYHGGGGGGDNLHVGFQPSSAAFEYMRSLDSQSGGGGGVDGGRMTPPPRPLHGGGMGGDYPPQTQHGQSPETSPNAYGRQGRTPRRPRRTTRATGAGGGPPSSPDEMLPGPLPASSRMVSDMPISVPSPQPVMSGSGRPIFQDNEHDSSGPHTASMPMPAGYGGRGPRGYDEPMAISRPPLTSSSPYDNNDGPGGPSVPAGSLQQDSSSGSFMPDAPYQNMMNTFNSNNNAPDPTVERARNIMASRSGGGVSGTAGDNSTVGSRPVPIAGRPMPPETPSIEPSVPPAQLRRRILSNKPKREPDLVRGKAVQQITSSSSKKTHVLCSGCAALLQISKSAIVVHCRNCNGVYPTASCPLPNAGR